MKKKLLLIFALFVSIGTYASVFDTNVAEGATATNLNGNVDVSKILNAESTNPGYDTNEESRSIVVTLSEAKTIDGFSISFRGDRWVSKFTLSYSVNGEDYSQIGEYTTGITENTNTTIAKTFDSPITAKYIKYTTKRADKNDNDKDQYSEYIYNFQLLQYGDAISTSGVDESQVLPIFSPTYNLTEMGDCNATYGGYKNKTNNDLFTSVSEKYIQGKTIKDVTGVGICGRTKGSAGLTGYALAYIAVYPTTATKGYIFEDNAYDSKVSFAVTPGQWNYITVPVSYSQNFASLYFENETEFYLADFYFIKPAAGEIVIAKSGEKDVVIGEITSSNKSTIEASTASVIDISGATLASGVTEISLGTNQFLAVDCTSETEDNNKGNITSLQGAALTGNTKNVIAKGEYYYSYQPLEIVDDNDHQPNTNISVNVYKTGYTIKRTIASGKYVTAYLPYAVNKTDIPEGLTVYAFDQSSTASDVKFTKNTGTLAGATPYVLHNSTDNDLTLTVTVAAGESGIDFNLNVDVASVENSSNDISFIGNYKVKAGTGEEYGLSNSAGEAPEFKVIGTSGKIGAFRAYFTGLSASARAIFVDNNTTLIGTIKADGRVEMEKAEVYDLQGHRVARPTKGLYIVNGKKVILK